MRTILTVIGARPQFIKAAPVARALREAGLVETLVHTGQHYDDAMSEQFFRELEIPAPRHNLAVGSASHGAQTGAMLQGLEPIVLKEKPDCLLVYGDTNSTLAGALVAAKLHVPVAHVEAGLRSFNRRMPEELNRILTDHASDILFAPTATAIVNLAAEGISGGHVHQVGDVMYDVALDAVARSSAAPSVLEKLGLTRKGYVLATLHRAENTDDPIRMAILTKALETVATRIPVVLPAHPRTRPQLAGLRTVRVIDPVGYLEMVQLEAAAAVVATDSGGVQKEAYFHHVPCVTLRTETEWVELVELGWNTVVPPHDPDSVSAAILGAIGTVGRAGAPYGSGDAAKKVAHLLASG